MVELQNFGHMNISTIIWIKIQNFDDDVKVKNHDVITLILKYLSFKKAWSSRSQFWCHCHLAVFIKNVIKNSKKGKRIRNYVPKRNLYLYFLIYQNLLISNEKMLMLAEFKGWVTWFIYLFASSLGKVQLRQVSSL